MHKSKSDEDVLDQSFVLSPNENYRGLSYGEIIARWNMWLMSPDPDHNNIKEFAFLRGNIGYHKDPQSVYQPKMIEIRQDTPIIMPLVSTLYCIGDCYEGGDIRNDQELIHALNHHVSEAGPFWATIQVRESKQFRKFRIVENVEEYRFHTPFFDIDISPSNPFLERMDVAVYPGRRRALGGGYFLLLKELPPAKYSFEFGGKGLCHFYTASQYDIKVVSTERVKPKDISRLAVKRSGMSISDYFKD